MGAADSSAADVPPAAAPPPEKPPATAAVEPQPGGEAARLVAMKMALDGSSRDDVAEHLAAELDLADADALLDDVFKRAGR